VAGRRIDGRGLGEVGENRRLVYDRSGGGECTFAAEVRLILLSLDGRSITTTKYEAT